MDDAFPIGMTEAIAEFLSQDKTRLSGKDVYQEVFDNPLMFPLQRQRELVRMMQIARSINPKVVYEIGSDKAGGLYHWIKCLLTVRRVIACEIRGTPYASAFNKTYPAIDFLWLPKSSHDPLTVEYVRKWLNTDKIDCLFIDGEKAEFLKDFDSYLPLMNPNGIVFMHDVQDSAPVEAFYKVSQRGYRCERIIDIQDTNEALQRMREGIPAKSPHENWLRHWKGRSAGVGVIYLGEKRL